MPGLSPAPQFEYFELTVLHTGGMMGTVWRLGNSTALMASVALSVCAGTAHAAGPPAQGMGEMVARERPATRSFYGWQILATGEVGGVLAAASAVIPESPLKTFPSTMGFLVGMPLYALGGPATHWTHGDFEKGLMSLGGNFVVPVVSGFVGQAVGCAGSEPADDCGTSGFLTGFAIALVTVPLVDALVLGWEDIPDDDPAVPAVPAAPGSAAASRRSRAKRVAQFAMTPAWRFGPKGELAFGVMGRF